MLNTNASIRIKAWRKWESSLLGMLNTNASIPNRLTL